MCTNPTRRPDDSNAPMVGALQAFEIIYSLIGIIPMSASFQTARSSSMHCWKSSTDEHSRITTAESDIAEQYSYRDFHIQGSKLAAVAASAIYFIRMSDPKDSVLDKAESIARRVLDRIGSSVESKITPPNEETLKPQVIAELATRVERDIESNLEKDDQGIRRVAPNRIKVLFTYEETSKLSPQYIEMVGKELTATAIEYINNRRYTTRGPVAVEVGRDLFTKTTSVKASFQEGREQSDATKAQSASGAKASKSICFNSSEGREYRADLKIEGSPVYIGRAAGNAIRIDDASVSRLHCSLSVRTDGVVVIADLGSVNGTSLNKSILGRDEARALAIGDVVGVGDFELTVSEIS